MKKPYLTTEWVDEETGATGYLVIHNLLNGFSAGGIRMREGVTKDEVARLAEIMSVKMVGLGMEIGGAKGGINFPSNHPKSKDVLKRYLEAHLPYLKEIWLTSEDLGTREEDIVEILNEYGLATSVQAYIDKSERKHVILSELGKAMKAKYDNISLTDLVTGYGVAVVTIEGLKYLNRDLKHSTVSVQGFGSVGASAAKFLYENGVKVVAVSDVEGVIYSKDGLNVHQLLEQKNNRGEINRENLPKDYQFLNRDQWVEIEADVLIPCAIADVIHEGNVSKVKTKLIVEGANIPVTKEAEEVLFNRGILVIPDFIANSGGAGLFVSILHANVKGEPEEVFTFLKKQLSTTINQLLTLTSDRKVIVRKAAKELKRETVK